MDGFFTKKQTQSVSRPDGKIYSCASCGLYKGSISAKMKPTGKFKKGIINIGEFPVAGDDFHAKHWQGSSGKYLKEAYKAVGIHLHEDCLNINAVNCYSKRKIPSTYQVDCCRSVLVDKILKEYQPKVIVLFGSLALYSFLATRWKNSLGKLDKWRGFVIPDQDYKTFIIPAYSPSMVYKADSHIKTIWKGDLQKVATSVHKGFPRNTKMKIKTIEDLSILSESNPSTIAFDYETTGLKPQAAGHRIICASVAVSPHLAYTFMMPNTKRGRKPFVDLLADPNIGKMAHNMKFEHNWTRARLNTIVKNWEWDSMLAAHLLDNRKEITGLKFQTYVNFGVIDYASEVTPYLKSVNSSDSNSLNRIHELLEKPGGKEQLLKYCALDSIYEYRLATKQIAEIDYDYLPF